ncbi:hypothetical protein [Peptoniphilus sp. HCN-40583]|uniref:hypothetical protein n=1 Tax=Peptoniphilus sp. HCN-40583 TaxID=3134662 RepID=UPI0030BFD52E
MKSNKRKTVTKQGAMLLLEMITEDIYDLKRQIPDQLCNFVDDTCYGLGAIAKYVDRYGIEAKEGVAKNLRLGNQDLQLLFIASFRYALGRRSYITSAISDIIQNNVEVLTDNTVKLMIKEIQECENLGMDCDKEVWQYLAEFLEERV